MFSCLFFSSPIDAIRKRRRWHADTAAPLPPIGFCFPKSEKKSQCYEAFRDFLDKSLFGRLAGLVGAWLREASLSRARELGFDLFRQLLGQILVVKVLENLTFREGGVLVVNIQINETEGIVCAAILRI